MTTRQYHVILDEAHRFFANTSDDIREILRKIDDIPNATYSVDDDRVFVFEKLVSLVKNGPGILDLDVEPRRKAILELLPGAYVSPIEAIKQWNIVPEPYTVENDTNGHGFVIRHKAFNAIIPPVFFTQERVDGVLANLLVGGIEMHCGDFSYRGQPMLLCEDFDLAKLPVRPTIHYEWPGDDNFTASEDNKFEEGFAPISNELYEQIITLDAAWSHDIAYASRRAHKCAEVIWSLINTLPLATLNSQNDNIDDCSIDDLNALRNFYPELHMLTDDSLYSLFDTYQQNCRFMNGWEAERDDSFLFYLIGKLTDNQLKYGLDEAAGEMTAFHLLLGFRSEDAMDYGRQCIQYTIAMRSIAYRAKEAMRFIAKDKARNGLHGSSISTTMDLFRIGRKHNTQVQILMDIQSE